MTEKQTNQYYERIKKASPDKKMLHTQEILPIYEEAARSGTQAETEFWQDLASINQVFAVGFLHLLVMNRKTSLRVSPQDIQAIISGESLEVKV